MTWLLPQMALVTRTLLGLPHQIKAKPIGFPLTHVRCDASPAANASSSERLGFIRAFCGELPLRISNPEDRVFFIERTFMCAL
jgi:hypothetical protein